jgi:hypothetical protein
LQPENLLVVLNYFKNFSRRTQSLCAAKTKFVINPFTLSSLTGFFVDKAGKKPKVTDLNETLSG